MLLKECNGCKYLARLIGIGQGVRCTNPENQITGMDGSKAIVISQIENCNYYKQHKKDKKES